MANSSNEMTPPKRVRPEIPRIVVYSGTDPRKGQGSLFYLLLLWAVITEGRAQGMEVIPVMDIRPMLHRDGPPPEVISAQKAGPIDGYVAIMVYESMIEWIRDSGTPFAMVLSNQKNRATDFDFESIIGQGISRFAELGCRSMGIMIPAMIATAPIIEMIVEKSQALNIEFKYEWIIVSREAMEVTGYQQFQSLWNLAEHPDGLMIFPDVMARGVVSAIVERKVDVPKELKLILHRNMEAPYTVPFQCDWFELSVDPIAKALLRILENQWAGREAPLEIVDFRLVKELEV